MIDHVEDECPRPVNGMERELVRRMQGESSELVEAVESVPSSFVSALLQPSRMAILGMLRSPDQTVRRWGGDLAVGKVHQTQDWKASERKVEEVERAATAILGIVLKSGGEEEKEWARTRRIGRFRGAFADQRTRLDELPDSPASPWQDAIRRMIEAGGDPERAEYLHDEWEKQYPPVADEPRSTEETRRSRKAVSALRKMLKGPHAEIEGRTFEDEPSHERLFDLEGMVRSGVAGPVDAG